MFRIKICGITSAADALVAAEAGADAVGLNFFPLSPRYVTDHQADEIVAALPARVAKVGVFVNSPAIEVCAIAARLKLDHVQVHGDEPPEFLNCVGGFSIIRAFRCGADLQPLFDHLLECAKLGRTPDMVLIDAHASGHYGGTGEVADWQAVATARERFAGIPIVLAGGLNPSNVGQAIGMVRPAAVDTASGVECAPGKKSATLIRAFIEAAQAAFQQPVPE